MGLGIAPEKLLAVQPDLVAVIQNLAGCKVNNLGDMQFVPTMKKDAPCDTGCRSTGGKKVQCGVLNRRIGDRDCIQPLFVVGAYSSRLMLEPAQALAHAVQGGWASPARAKA